MHLDGLKLKVVSSVKVLGFFYSFLPYSFALIETKADILRSDWLDWV